MDIRKRNGKSGMTLIEILIVIALLGVLAGVLVRSLGSSLEAGKKATAKLFCTSTAKSAIEAYKAIHGNKLPTAKENLYTYIGGEEAMQDPWGKSYEFKHIPVDSDKPEYVVIYSGADPSGDISKAMTATGANKGQNPSLGVAAANTFNEKEGNNVCGVHF